MEDLWAFNEEPVVRAIAASQLPIVSAVGHEIDFTLADFAADLRAATPSAAAELVVPNRGELLEKIKKLRERALHALVRTYREKAMAYKHLSETGIFTRPALIWEAKAQALDTANQKMTDAIEKKIQGYGSKLAVLDAKLQAMSPLRILARGYTVTENADGQLLKSSAQLKTGEILVTRFKDGQVVSQVKEISQGKGEEE